MSAVADSSRTQIIIGVDVGGTKCAAGLIALPEGVILASRRQPTLPNRGGQAVLADVVEICRSLQMQSAELGVVPHAIGIGIAELVGISGQVLSSAAIEWKDMAIVEVLRKATGLTVRVDADVRAAARAEACHGAGRQFQSFIYVTIGTGISASLVVNRVPYAGARGLTGTFASSRTTFPQDDGELAVGPPLESFAAGPALAARFASALTGFAGTSFDVISLADRNDELALKIVISAGTALGAAIGQLVNMLDPQGVVIGGGLGLVEGRFRSSVETAMRDCIWCDLHRDIPLLSARLGNDAGIVGAALAATCP